MLRLSLPALFAALLVALPSASCSEPAADRAFNDKVHAYILSHPEVITEALGRAQAQQEATAAATASAGIMSHRQQLERDPGDFVANPGGKVTVVEFFDYKCTYCKASADQVVAMVHANPDVRFVFKEFPILSEVSTHAAADQLVTRDQGNYLGVFQALMGQKGLDDTSLGDILRAKGVDPARATPDVRAAADRHLADNRELAKQLGVDGTPAFVVDNKLIAGWQPEALQAGIDAQRRATGSRAGA